MKTELVAMSIPIIAIVMGIGIGMLALYLDYLKRKEMFTLYHQERMAAIDKGIELPDWPEGLLDTSAAKPQSPRRHLLKGLVWLFIGLGLIVSIYAVFDLAHSLFGLIPTGIGLAHLIYYFVEGKKEAPAQPVLASQA